MTIVQFHSEVLQINEIQLIDLISKNKRELKLLFINLEIEPSNTELLGQILVHLSAQELTDNARNSEEIQFLFTELAFYFKRNNNQGFVVYALEVICDSVLKNRLNAWIQIKQYSDIESNVLMFEEYLKKLSTAITDGVENYENEVLRDLNNYYVATIELFNEKNRQELLEKFNELFTSEELQNVFPILKYYDENKFQFSGEIQIKEIAYKIFEPSLFTESLFNDKFLNYIRHHSSTNWHRILLGYDNNTIRSQIIHFGQTNFDNGYKELKASDVVKLYSYFNMRKHYYSSLSLFERFDQFNKLYKSNGIIKFIDIGCGPATSGIALIDYLSSIGNTPVSFDYFGVDYYKSMRDEAKIFMDNSLYTSVSHEEYITSLNDFDFDWLANANSIFVNACYLFASDSLDEIELAKSVQNIKKAKPDVPFYFLFQNTTNPLKNTKYFKFKNQFANSKELLTENNTIRYNNKRNSTFPPESETIFFEILEIT
ncbi:hypothetical protein [Flavobacterium hydrophilum]|uniref:Methyltransferase domain-containing protein n=1 Tax=Flavobacterium hydrophilum TaxID=2211445 RepID=A0A2V4C587_9FLAO|nr:hypothetical protein [Flavobacterium hydrophilum]PXY46498.1 hypothetical protein DMB68_04805 [Flavobacterium hydrophilum]